jgi:glycine cleavage system H lipoate-binding protein
MVALFVLATFLLFIAVDVILNREKYKFRVAEEAPVPAPERPVFGELVAGVPLPAALAYHPGHTWAMDLGHGRVRMGVDAFAASLLGTLQKVELPKRGRWLRQGEKGWAVTAANGEVVMLAPAEGEIININEAALADPASVAADPYGQGWLVEIFSPDTPVSFRNLLSGAFAIRWMEESVKELRMAFSPAVPVTALDGGIIVSNVGDDLTPEQWSQLTQKFFRS